MSKANISLLMHSLSSWRPTIDKALAITEAFIVEQELVLTGGMAVDQALRQKGDSIYSDSDLPDYDVISDENVARANALARKLCEEGLPSVNVINALHSTTVRVRVRNVVVMDATYVPTSCLARIPVLQAGSLRVVHPHYQFVDQRLSLSMLMASTGSSLNVMHRLVKDLERNELLRAMYPIEPAAAVQAEPTRWVEIPLDTVRVADSDLRQAEGGASVLVCTSKTCIAGYVGFLIMMDMVEQKKNSCVTVTETGIRVEVPVSERVTLLTHDMAAARGVLSADSTATYRRLLDLAPASLRDASFALMDTFGQRVGCNILTLGGSAGPRVCVASVDYLLMEMLRDRVFDREEPHTTRYSTLVGVVDQMCADARSDDIWWPSLHTYGDYDLSNQLLYKMVRVMQEREKNGHKEKETDSVSLPRPKASYLRAVTCKTRDGFDPDTSPLFRTDGALDNDLPYTSYRHITLSFHEHLQQVYAERAAAAKAATDAPPA